MSADLAVEVGGLFKALANDTRLRILHELVRSREACVSDIAAALGASPQAISNQLQKMSAWRILSSRRSGTNIYYRIVNPCIPELLDRAVCFVEYPRSRLGADVGQGEGTRSKPGACAQEVHADHGTLQK